MTGKEPEHPLDHATARIVAELAASLLPHLKETVSAELARTVESLPINVNREVEKALSSLKRLQALFEGMEKVLNSARDSALLLSNELLPLSRICETLNTAAARLEQLAGKPETDDAEMNELLRSLEADLSDWGGILKANGRAHTRELCEFSAEVSEQVGWMKSDMPKVVGEILEKTLLSRTEEWARVSGESVRTLETKLTALEKTAKIILTEGVVLVALLAALAAALYFGII